MNQNHRRLVLFDIDGTLLTDGGAARDAYGSALREVYGYDGDLLQFDFSGRTDPQITHMVLGEAGLERESIEQRLPALWELYLAALASRATGRVSELPGVRSLLQALSKDSRVTLALLTGNLEPGAWIKLREAGLEDFFPFGAFGSDSELREELPPIAVQRASDALGHHFHGGDVVIIGDSIYDVRCGVPHAATTIAIASGKTSAERLLAENPHHFFQSAEDLEGLLAAIVGEPNQPSS